MKADDYGFYDDWIIGFEHQVFDVNEFDFDKDTIIFTIKEPQRVWFEKYAVQKIIKWKGKLKKNPYRWICQIFLPREIEKYLVK